MRRFVVLAVLSVLALPLAAEILGTNSISVTSTATSVTFARTVTSVCMYSSSASANDAFARLYTTGETVAAATTASPIRIRPGEGHCFSFSAADAPGATGYVGLSIITAATETATARWVAK